MITAISSFIGSDEEKFINILTKIRQKSLKIWGELTDTGKKELYKKIMSGKIIDEIKQITDTIKGYLL